MVALYDNRLQELYEADLATGEVKRVSHFNDAALEGKYVAVPQPLSVESEGWTIGGAVRRTFVNHRFAGMDRLAT